MKKILIRPCYLRFRFLALEAELNALQQQGWSIDSIDIEHLRIRVVFIVRLSLNKEPAVVRPGSALAYPSNVPSK